MKKLLTITKFGILDILQHKSFYAILIISAVFVLMLRGCYKGNYIVNGQKVDNITVAWHASKIAFGIIASGALLIAAMLAMGILRRERDDGTAAYILSKPVARDQYAAGKVLSAWLVSGAFMFILHLIIFFISWASAGGFMPGYLSASLVCSINLLFMVLLVLLLSTFIADVPAVLIALGIVGVSYVSDGMHQVMSNAMVKQALQSEVAGKTALWRMLWPKISDLQAWASSLIGNGDFRQMGPAHPAVNVAIYIVILAVLLTLKFRKNEM
jgi:ABC-type transport system involved in multi-copper enzyme maturation permease subunit